jgi:hypothetical protein
MLVAALVCNGAACDFSQTCTDVGCETGLTLSVRRASGTWADGDYVLAAGTERCNFSIPRDLPAVGSITRPGCDGGTQAQLGNSGLELSLSTTPKTLAVSLTRDRSVILSETSTPRYQESQPNGPDCGPVCRQADVDLAVLQ